MKGLRRKDGRRYEREGGRREWKERATDKNWGNYENEKGERQGIGMEGGRSMEGWKEQVAEGRGKWTEKENYEYRKEDGIRKRKDCFEENVNRYTN